jgi:hypothetical protein
MPPHARPTAYGVSPSGVAALLANAVQRATDDSFGTPAGLACTRKLDTVPSVPVVTVYFLCGGVGAFRTLLTDAARQNSGLTRKPVCAEVHRREP